MTGPGDPAGGDLTKLSDSLSSMASVVLNEETLDAVLDMVVSLATSAIPGIYGASVSLQRTRQLETRTATSESVRVLDAHQYETGQGPCVTAIATGERQHVTMAELRSRWP